jgi:hypothetical protein
LIGESSAGYCEMQLPDLDQAFPGLRGTGYDITSPQTTDYNCIAWAASDSSNWWQPDPFAQYYWPPGVPRLGTVEAHEQAFAQLGFEPCLSLAYEAGFEKVAIYVDANQAVTHMARQLPDGKWTSKLGQSYDITHDTLRDIEGQEYGTFRRVLRRPSN